MKLNDIISTAVWRHFQLLFTESLKALKLSITEFLSPFYLGAGGHGIYKTPFADEEVGFLNKKLPHKQLFLKKKTNGEFPNWGDFK